LRSLRRLVAGIPASPDARRFLFVSLVDAVGSGMFAPIAILYLTRIVGLSPGIAGLGLGVAAAASLVATPVSGTLADRVDSRTVAFWSYVALGLAYVLYAGVRSFWTFVLVASLIEVARSLSFTARRIMIFSLSAETSRVELLAYMRSIRNVGFGLGGLLSAVALASGSRTAYTAIVLGNAASYLYAAWNFRRLPRAPAAAAPSDAEPGGYRIVLRNRRFLALSAVSGTLNLNSSILQIGMALWIVRETTAPAWIVGLLFTLNTVIVVALQVPASRGTESPRGLGRAYARGGFSLAACSALYVLAAHRGIALAVVLLVAATIVLTAGEMLTSAAEWAAPTILAPAHLRGRYLAAIRTATGVEDMAGPVAVSVALASGGRLGFAGLGALMLVAGLAGDAVARGAKPPGQ
jgi:Na+/melibiose symporter-like transporter